MEKSIIKLLITVIGLQFFIVRNLSAIEENQIKIKTDTGRNYNNILELKK